VAEIHIARHLGWLVCVSQSTETFAAISAILTWRILYLCSKDKCFVSSGHRGRLDVHERLSSELPLF